MYSINSLKTLNGEIDEIVEITGFPMGSNSRIFKVEGAGIKAVSISSKQLASPLVEKIVSKKYNKLILILTDLLVEEDDDSGDSVREALNHIEKFRLEIKNKYRDYLKKKQLDMMAKKLMLIQKECSERLIQIRENLINRKEERRSK